MSDHFYNFNNSLCIVSCPNIFKYKGLLFEYHSYLGPVILNKDYNPRNRNIGRKSCEIINQWEKLSPSKKKRTLIFN